MRENPMGFYRHLLVIWFLMSLRVLYTTWQSLLEKELVTELRSLLCVRTQFLSYRLTSFCWNIYLSKSPCLIGYPWQLFFAVFVWGCCCSAAAAAAAVISLSQTQQCMALLYPCLPMCETHVSNSFGRFNSFNSYQELC